MKLSAKTLIIPLGVAALLAAGLGCGRSKPAATTATARLTPVLVQAATRGSLQNELTLTGTAAANRDSTLNAEIAGSISGVYVNVGDRVRAGQPLVQLDTALTAAQLAQATASVRSAQARSGQANVNVKLTDESTRIAVQQAEVGVDSAQQQFKRAQANYDLTRSSVENGIQQAQTGVNSAQASLRDIRAGSRAQEIASAQANVDQAAAAAALAHSDLKRNQSLLDAGAISAQQVETARTNATLADARLAQAKQALSLAQEGARTEQVRLAELSVQQALQSQQLAESRRDQIVVAQRDVNSAQAGLTNAQQALSLARSQRQQVAMQQQEAAAAGAAVGQARAGEQYSRASLSKFVIRAPFDGEVAEKLIERGQGAGVATPLIRVVNVQPIKVQAQVSELQIAGLKVGETARVTVDALPGRIFAGRIARISPATNLNQRLYTVEVNVDNAQRLIKPGMFCRVQLVLQQLHDVVIIPRDALVESGDQRMVYVVQDGKVAVRPVEIGASSNSQVQAVSGVQPGDQLIISGQSLLAAGQAVQPQGASATPLPTEQEAAKAGLSNGAAPSAAAPTAAPPGR
ncbi:MAG TPA: efflux RND transporter periplasmic adaptor subunit [Armatimonadota bacterium]|jgi:membrane fusion protein (multidrug efflux system)